MYYVRFVRHYGGITAMPPHDDWPLRPDDDQLIIDLGIEDDHEA